MTIELGNGGSKLLLALVRLEAPRKGGCECEGGEKPGEGPPPGGPCGGEIRRGEHRMPSESGSRKTPDDSPGPATSAGARGEHLELDLAPKAVPAECRQGGQKAGQRVGRVALKKVVKLTVRSEREHIGRERKVGNSQAEPARGIEGGRGDGFEPAVRVAGQDCGPYGRDHRSGYVKKQPHLTVERPVLERHGQPRLMQGGEHLLHVGWGTGIVRRGDE